MELNTMQQQVVDMFKKYEQQGTESWTYQTAAHDLQYQLGKLSKCVLQLENKRFNEGLTEPQIKIQLADELADIMAEVLFIAAELDINLAEAWAGMLASDEKKIEERS